MDDTRKIKNLLMFMSTIMAFSALYFARDLFLPIVIGLIVALTLSPVVRSLAHLRIPEPVSSVILIFGAVLVLALGFYLLSGPASDILKNAPEMGIELQQKLRGLIASLEDAKNASEQVEAITNNGSNTQKVTIEQPGFLEFAAGSLVSFMGLTFVGLILAMFILASGDLFYVKLVEALPNFSDKRLAIRTAHDIERRISNYFLTITIINAGLGFNIGIAMYLIGLPNPALWGVLAFPLNFLPFVGAIVGAALVAAFGILSFETLGSGIMPAIIYLLLTSVEGQFITPTVLGRRLEMNTVSVLLTVIIWSWLWSIPGALMAVPFLVLLKVICDNVASLSVIGSFLGPRKAAKVS